MSNTAQRAAALLLEAVGATSTPPIPVEQIAMTVGVEAIRVAPLLEDGRLEITGGIATIFVNAQTGCQRQRFTVAHELAHWLLADREQEFIAYRARPESADAVERFCDEFAASLLLPENWVRTQIETFDSKLEITQRVARESNTSLTATFRRLRDVGHWPQSLITLQIGRNGWQLQRMIGGAASLRNVKTGVGFSNAVARAQRLRDPSVRLPLVLNGRQIRPQADIMFDNSRNALATVDLRLGRRLVKQPVQMKLF